MIESKKQPKGPKTRNSGFNTINERPLWNRFERPPNDLGVVGHHSSNKMFVNLWKRESKLLTYIIWKLVTTLSKTQWKRRNILNTFFPKRLLNAYIFRTVGDRSFLSNFNPPLITPTALKDDLSIEVFIKTIAPIRCTYINFERWY